MAEYIEKQAAVEIAMQYCPDDDGSCSRAGEDIRDLLDELENLPPADVRPVVRGRWIEVSGFVTPGGDPVWKCSECGKGRHTYGIEHGTYGADIADGQWVSCPNCMADMRGGDADGG